MNCVRCDNDVLRKTGDRYECTHCALAWGRNEREVIGWYWQHRAFDGIEVLVPKGTLPVFEYPSEWSGPAVVMGWRIDGMAAAQFKAWQDTMTLEDKRIIHAMYLGSVPVGALWVWEEG